MNDKQAPLPSYLTVDDYSCLLTLKSPICCKYNYPNAIHKFLTSKIIDNEETNDSSDDNKVKKRSLSNCCNCNSSDSIDALVDEEGRLTNWGVASASHPIPSTCNLYYYEVKILNDGKTKEIEIGIAMKEWPWENVGYYHGIGYRGNDGKLYVNSDCGKEYGLAFGKNDVIGCGINLQTKDVFFTRNGMIIGLTNEHFDDTKNWLPAVSLHAKNAKVEFNFGNEPFMFDICK